MRTFSNVSSSSLYQSFKRWWRRVRQYRKDAQLALARVIFDHRQSARSYDPSEAKHIAVFRWDDKLGDSIMATLFVDAVSRERPDIEITYITGKQGVSLLGGWSAINNLIVCGRRGWKTAWSLRKLKGKYDLVLELGSGMSAYELFALRQLRAKHYLSYGKQDYALFDLNVGDDAIHFPQRYLAAASIAVGRSVEGHFYLPESKDARRIAQDYIRSKPEQSTKALINLFAAGKHRSFTDEDAEEFLRWWLGQWPDIELMLLSVPGREEQLDRLLTAIGSMRISRTPFPASIELTVALAKEADLVFSPDTAVVHIVAALGCPMIAVYRLKGQEFDAWHPWGSKARVLFNRQAVDKYDRVPAADFSWPILKREVDEIIAQADHGI
tara:strand:- start:97 stop:1245 length:1149 start_codon:yes stop_codon:yes gene_type:complete